MPDLGTFHIKRSRHQVHYIYVHHSIVSTHMIYRQGAFDNFDSILCVGPHHKEEIRATEDLYSLKPKILVKVGYGNLDSILLSTDSPDDSAEGNTTVAAEGKRILIAPSWGENGLLESHGAELAEVLLGAGHHVIVRPHMMTIRQRPKLLNSLRERFASYPEFHLELGLSFQGTVGQADIMISDWSGAALEFAFGLERPVIFIDVPRKINNPDYQKIPCVPVEVMLRSDLGEVVSPDRLSDVPAIVDRLCQNPGLWQDRIRELRSRWIYNIRTSGKVAADYIAETAENAQTA
jgi:YidC/Oxa1 family membrane protein insertase